MSRVENTSAALHRVGLQDIITLYNDGLTSWWKDIAPVEITTTQQFYRFLSEGDFGMAAKITQASPIPDDDIFYGYSKDVTPIKRGLGFSISTEALESDQYGRLANVVPKIKLAFNKTKEQAVADRINNATTGGSTYGNPDLKALAATDHPLETGTDSNLITNAFSAGALETMIQLMKMQKSHRGDPDPQVGPFVLLIHPSQRFLAERVVFSSGQQGTANNDTNRVGSQITKIVDSPYFTSTTFWALRNAHPKQQPFAMLNRRSLRVKTEEDIDNDLMKYRLTEMYAPFERGWRGYFHSTGAG